MIKYTFVIYALLSLLTICHAGLKNSFCVAHRGNSPKEYENSYAAILSAANLGVGAIEFDIQHTSDGVALINHDKKLKRTVIEDEDCDDETPLIEQLYKDLEHCRLKNNETIPLFSKIVKDLKPYPSRLFIEYKSEPTINEIKLLSELYSDQPERIYFISFKEDYLDKIINWRKDFTFLRKTKIIRIKQIAYSRKDRFDGLNTNLLAKRHVRSAHRNGRLIGTFTKNSIKKIKKYLKKGVDFLTTDNPNKCMLALRKIR
jgi:glycerophosphoryl diester phosphodiesterase